MRDTSRLIALDGKLDGIVVIHGAVTTISRRLQSAADVDVVRLDMESDEKRLAVRKERRRPIVAWRQMQGRHMGKETGERHALVPFARRQDTIHHRRLLCQRQVKGTGRQAQQNGGKQAHPLHFIPPYSFSTTTS